ncbi:hypothetical protein DYB25_013255 [Aphanomyces astaci]|uniref:Uncharacterized protein n=1 Tax=Aphanomyces astaci TaxID=112090 RepID=A0A397DL34_APHAT|nr:hypothetical protein DYB36_000059 [Aphanomyces astaci]RHY19818.1 hypothetical protein DYB25_013255 [Aphanomyces astaci]RHY64519.1 hypothetical protein DYB38_000636 [Aphanomyces astaci]RHZ18802.1 hypothetical protein DYB26_002714 [Aphanomyces astaci]
MPARGTPYTQHSCLDYTATSTTRRVIAQRHQLCSMVDSIISITLGGILSVEDIAEYGIHVGILFMLPNWLTIEIVGCMMLVLAIIIAVPGHDGHTPK